MGGQCHGFGRDSGTWTHIYGLKGRYHWPFRRYPPRNVPVRFAPVAQLAVDIFRAILDSEVNRRFPLPQFWFEWSIATRVVINYLVQPTTPCVRPLRVTDLIISVPTNGGIRWATSFRFEDNHTASASPFTRGLQRDMPLHAYLSQSPQIGGRGLCSHRPLGAS